MSRVVFILGAGASKQCGAPVMAEFLDVASRLHATGVAKDKKEHFERVFRAISALQTVHSKAQLDLNNVESIFTALEIANVLGKLPSFEKEEIPNVIASLKEVIVATLENTINFPANRSYIGAPKPYENFAEVIKYIEQEAFPSLKAAVITFNYDIAIDIALFRAGMGPNYCIKSDTLGVPLMKLHGSLNWASEVETGNVIPLALKDYFSHYSIVRFAERQDVKIPSGSQLQACFKKMGKNVEPEPVIVPPTWNKADHHQMLSQVWGRAAKELQEAEYVFIIGYSLPVTDAFFRLLYAIGTVGDIPLKKIMVINPDTTGEVKERFRSMLGPGALARYEYEEADFNASTGIIQNMFPKK